MADTSLIARIALPKYEFALPLNLQERISKLDGFYLPRSILSDWIEVAYKLCAPVVEAIHAESLSESLLHWDRRNGRSGPQARLMPQSPLVRLSSRMRYSLLLCRPGTTTATLSKRCWVRSEAACFRMLRAYIIWFMY